MNAQNVIVGSIGIATANNVVANLNNNSPKPWFPQIVGGFAVSVGLLVFSEFQPTVARAFAIIILIASLVGPNGTALVNLIVKLTGATATGPRTSAGRGNTRL